MIGLAFPRGEGGQKKLMRGSFTDSVCFSLLLAGLWCSRHSHCLCGVGHDLTPASNVCTSVSVCVYMYVGEMYALVCVCKCMCVYVYAGACVCVWGEWRAACLCLVWLGFTRPLGSSELDSLTAWTGRREQEREGKRRRRGAKKRGGGTLRARRAWAHMHTHTHAYTLTHVKSIYMPPGTEMGL